MVNVSEKCYLIGKRKMFKQILRKCGLGMWCGLKLPWIKIFWYRDQCLGYRVKKIHSPAQIAATRRPSFSCCCRSKPTSEDCQHNTSIYHYINRYFRLLVLVMCHHTEYSYMEVWHLDITRFKYKMYNIYSMCCFHSPSRQMMTGNICSDTIYSHHVIAYNSACRLKQ
jgi:hypothetical protein